MSDDWDTITMDDALGVLGLERVRLGIYRCPSCGHRGMKVREERWYCFPCDFGGGPVLLAARVWRLPAEEAYKRLRRELCLETTHATASKLLERVDKAEARVDAGRERDVAGVLAILDGFWDEAARGARYAAELGVLLDEARPFYVLRERVLNGQIRDTAEALSDGARALRAFQKLTKERGVAWPAKPDYEPLPKVPVTKLKDGDRLRRSWSPAQRTAFDLVCYLLGLAWAPEMLAREILHVASVWAVERSYVVAHIQRLLKVDRATFGKNVKTAWIQNYEALRNARVAEADDVPAQQVLF